MCRLICRDHLFDPSLIEASLPKSYRLLLAAEYADRDPAVAEVLKTNAKYAAYAVGSLCFVSVGSFVVDGVRVHSSGAMPMAFWWVRASGPRDARMLGKVDWLQLASWYSRHVTHRQRVLATDPMAQFVDLEVLQVAPGLWHLRLALPQESIEAEVRGSGQRVERDARGPQYMSVPFAGNGAGSFWVISYFGHHEQSTQSRWRTSGAGVFSEALQIPGEATVFRTSLQDGWSALSGLYQSER